MSKDSAKKNTSFENHTIKVKKYFVKGENKVSPQYVEQFLHALRINKTDDVISLLKSFPQLATLSGDFFQAPLIIAGMHHNTFIMNHLLELGACPRMARRKAEFKKLPVKSRTYLELICNFKARVLEKIHTMH
tara:strand:- start:10376 stop:10774 length:399 start_codon:yes stop_codon:yes gene_type:complete